MADLATIVHNILVPGAPVLEKIVRPLAIYVFLVIGIRVAGKRTLASLNSFDLVVLLSISNTVQNAIIGDDTSIVGGMLGAATLLAMNYLTVRFFFRHQRLDHLIEGSATALIADGKVITRNLERELITEEELHVAARKQGFTDLEAIDSAEIEPGGAMVFTARKPTRDETENQELHRKLDELTGQVSRLIARLEGTRGG